MPALCARVFLHSRLSEDPFHSIIEQLTISHTMSASIRMPGFVWKARMERGLELGPAVVYRQLGKIPDSPHCDCQPESVMVQESRHSCHAWASRCKPNQVVQSVVECGSSMPSMA